MLRASLNRHCSFVQWLVRVYVVARRRRHFPAISCSVAGLWRICTAQANNGIFLHNMPTCCCYHTSFSDRRHRGRPHRLKTRATPRGLNQISYKKKKCGYRVRSRTGQNKIRKSWVERTQVCIKDSQCYAISLSAKARDYSRSATRTYKFFS